MNTLRFETLTLTATDKDSSPATVSGKTGSFGGPIISYGAALAGWELGYTSDDHHLRRVTARIVNVSLDPSDPTKVMVEASLGINDKNSDDRWSGSVDIQVTAFVAQS